MPFKDFPTLLLVETWIFLWYFSAQQKHWHSLARKLSSYVRRRVVACENSVGFSMCDCPIETVKYIWVSIWCMLDWILSQSCRNTTSLDAVVPYQLLAANIDAVAYQMEEYLKIQVWLWFCIVWTVFNTTTTWHFHYYMHCLGKTTR